MLLFLLSACTPLEPGHAPGPCTDCPPTTCVACDDTSATAGTDDSATTGGDSGTTTSGTETTGPACGTTTPPQAGSARGIYVSTTGDDATGDGTYEAPYATIQRGVDAASAGDVVRVLAGTYDERITVERDGSEDAWLNIVAEGEVVTYGFELVDVDYVRIIGFEVRHTSNDYRRGILLVGTCSHIDVLDNYIHDTNEAGILAAGDSETTCVTIRGNNLDYIGHIEGVWDEPTSAIGSSYITQDHWLVEYNTVSRSGDFTTVYGNHIVIRNNYFHDFANHYWGEAGSAIHSDMFQPGSDGHDTGTRDHLYEANFCGDSIEEHSHFGIWQDTVEAGDRNILLRGNVGFNFGSGGLGGISTDHLAMVNNTLHEMNRLDSNGAALIWYKLSGSSDYPMECIGVNNLIDDNGGGGEYAIYVEPGSTSTLSHNLGHDAGTVADWVSTADPQFLDPAARNFRLEASSPAVDAGTHLVWITEGAGSGRTFEVNDALLLNDGWGVMQGDTVTIGGATTTVTGITDDTVTVADEVSWSADEPVYWGTDTSPDIGALPYGSTELRSATLTEDGASYSVATEGDTRFVVFYEDGIPFATDYTAPYAATGTGGVVTARAYALYAQATPCVEATRD